jgi:hypothetical protein
MMRKMMRSNPPQPWIDWLAEQLRILRDGGILAFPMYGVAWRIIRAEKVLDTIIEAPSWPTCEMGRNHEATVLACGWTTRRGSPQQTWAEIEEAMKNGRSIVDPRMVEEFKMFFNPPDSKIAFSEGQHRRKEK